MEVTNELVDKIAELSRLQFEAQEKEAIKKDLSRMLDFVGQLEEVNTDGVEPLIFMTDEYDTLREDVSASTITQQQALKNAPKKDSDYFKVPKVMDK